MINYKFNEGALIKELQNYVDDTYNGHYSKNNFQSTEFIIDCGHGMGFALGNVLKYAQRYGKKDGSNRKDLMKILHYALIALHQHDKDAVEDEPIASNFTAMADNLTLTFDTDAHISSPAMYTTTTLDYNNSYSDVTVTVNGTSIDDATPEEWNEASAYAYGKTKK
jgi:hypothetical protein